MKITKNKLEQLIKEEIAALSENIPSIAATSAAEDFSGGDPGQMDMRNVYARLLKLQRALSVDHRDAMDASVHKEDIESMVDDLVAHVSRMLGEL